MQKTLTYYDNQSRQIYDIINPPIKYIYFQFPIESNVIAILKVHDKSTLFHGRKREREKKKESTSINYPDKSETSWTKRQTKEERNKKKKKRNTKKRKKKKEQYAKQRMQKCSAIVVDLSSNRINCDPRGGWMEHRCNDP